MCIQNPDSNFHKLMKLDNLFLIKERTGESDQAELFIDLVNLKIFALLMCRGSSNDKANVLFDLVAGPNTQN